MKLPSDAWWPLAALVHSGGLKREPGEPTWSTMEGSTPFRSELVDLLIEQGAALYTLAAPTEVTPTEAGVRFAVENGLVDIEAGRDRYQELTAEVGA